jgi:hypothetical protein
MKNIFKNNTCHTAPHNSPYKIKEIERRNMLFKNIKLIILIFVSYTIGLHMIISPEKVNHLIVRSSGLIWIIGAFCYISELIKTYIDYKISKTKY